MRSQNLFAVIGIIGGLAGLLLVMFQFSSLKTEGEGLTDHAIELQIHSLVNEERVKAGLPVLAWNEDAAVIARAWSKHMHDTGIFEHSTTFCYGENLFMTQGRTTFPAKDAVNLWMNSVSHRLNILDRDYTSEGIGVYQNYVTQNFCGGELQANMIQSDQETGNQPPRSSWDSTAMTKDQCDGLYGLKFVSNGTKQACSKYWNDPAYEPKTDGRFLVK